MGAAWMLALLVVAATAMRGATYSGELPRPPPGYLLDVIGKLDAHERSPIVVFLPGMDEDNDQVEDVFQYFADEHVATFVVAMAAKRYVATRMQKVRAWYDFRGYVRTPKNLIGYEESFEYVAELVRAAQARGRRVFLAGHGQGGALALDVALSKRSELIKPVDGVAVFAGYFITHDGFSSAALRETRVLWAHSQRDKKVPYAGAKYGFEKQLIKQHHLARGQFLKFETPKSRQHIFGERAAQLLRDFIEGHTIRPAPDNGEY